MEMTAIDINTDDLNKAILKRLGSIEEEDIQSIDPLDDYDYVVMDLIPDITDYITQDEEEPQLDAHEYKEVLKELHSKLTNREKQCFTLHACKEMSMSKIGSELGITKSAVQNYIERARKKIDAI